MARRSHQLKHANSEYAAVSSRSAASPQRSTDPAVTASALKSKAALSQPALNPPNPLPEPTAPTATLFPGAPPLGPDPLKPLADDFKDVVAKAVAILGGPNVAVIGGVSKTSDVAEWIRGKRHPKSEDREMRVRFAVILAEIIKTRFSDKSVRAWFLGANSRLDDETPIAWLADLPLARVQKPLLAAARAFSQI